MFTILDIQGESNYNKQKFDIVLPTGGTIHILGTRISCGIKEISGINNLIRYCYSKQLNLKDTIEKIIEACHEEMIEIKKSEYDYDEEGSVDLIRSQACLLDVPYYLISTTTEQDEWLDFCTKLTPQNNPNSDNEINLYVYERHKEI